MKQALLIGPIFSDFHVEYIKQLIAQEGYVHIVAVDGGADFSKKADVIPSLFVGDNDSVSQEALDYIGTLQVERIELNPDKDDSDLACALDWLSERGVSTVELIGFVGGRLDHQLALFGDIASRAIDAVLYDERQTLWIVTQRGRLPRKVVLPQVSYANFSVFALKENATVSIDGARWPLKNKVLEPLISLGLSNEFAHGAFDARVLVHQGAALVCANKTLS